MVSWTNRLIGIPLRCKAVAEAEGFSPYDIEVFNVHYTDCNDVWIMCRHHASPMSQIDMIDRFGRLPVRARSYIRHVLGICALLDDAIDRADRSPSLPPKRSAGL